MEKGGKIFPDVAADFDHGCYVAEKCNLLRCWFFNTTFLEKYYIFHKEKELKSSFLTR